ncbi:unnamed protein product [Amaranthus hypochondriacus]
MKRDSKLQEDKEPKQNAEDWITKPVFQRNKRATCWSAQYDRLCPRRWKITVGNSKCRWKKVVGRNKRVQWDDSKTVAQEKRIRNT